MSFFGGEGGGGQGRCEVKCSFRENSKNYFRGGGVGGKSVRGVRMGGGVRVDVNGEVKFL